MCVCLHVSYRERGLVVRRDDDGEQIVVVRMLSRGRTHAEIAFLRQRRKRYGKAFRELLRRAKVNGDALCCVVDVDTYAAERLAVQSRADVARVEQHAVGRHPHGGGQTHPRLGGMWMRRRRRR